MQFGWKAPGPDPATNLAKKPVLDRVKSDEEWRKELPPTTFKVLRQSGRTLGFTVKLSFNPNPNLEPDLKPDPYPGPDPNPDPNPTLTSKGAAAEGDGAARHHGCEGRLR